MLIGVLLPRRYLRDCFRLALVCRGNVFPLIASGTTLSAQTRNTVLFMFFCCRCMLPLWLKMTLKSPRKALGPEHDHSDIVPDECLDRGDRILGRHRIRRVLRRTTSCDRLAEGSRDGFDRPDEVLPPANRHRRSATYRDGALKQESISTLRSRESDWLLNQSTKSIGIKRCL